MLYFVGFSSFVGFGQTVCLSFRYSPCFFFLFVFSILTITLYCTGLELEHVGQSTITGKEMLGVTFDLR